MHSEYKTLLGCVLLLSCALFAAKTEAVQKYSSTQRFLVPGQEDMSGAENAQISLLDSNSLPETLRNDIQSMLDQCVMEKISLDSLRYYAYQSNRTRAKKSSPNVIVDFAAIAGKKLKSCASPYLLCQGGSCALAGYSNEQGSDKWKPVFGVLAIRWNIELTKPAENKHTRQEAYFTVVSDSPICKELGGAPQNGYCVQKLVWRGESLTPLDMSAAQEDAQQ